ncbi:hypothetical protein SRHO_G00259710 [Serrasalmus rhombeus]
MSTIQQIPVFHSSHCHQRSTLNDTLIQYNPKDGRGLQHKQQASTAPPEAWKMPLNVCTCPPTSELNQDPIEPDSATVQSNNWHEEACKDRLSTRTTHLVPERTAVSEPTNCSMDSPSQLENISQSLLHGRGSLSN